MGVQAEIASLANPSEIIDTYPLRVLDTQTGDFFAHGNAGGKIKGDLPLPVGVLVPSAGQDTLMVFPETTGEPDEEGIITLQKEEINEAQLTFDPYPETDYYISRYQGRVRYVPDEERQGGTVSDYREEIIRKGNEAYKRMAREDPDGLAELRKEQALWLYNIPEDPDLVQ